MAKKSMEPFLWTLFSAGGVLAALLVPVHLFLFGVALPLGWLPEPSSVYLLAVLRHPATRVYLFLLCTLALFHGAHRFFGPLLIREGCRIVQHPVTHRPRPHGKSNYNIWNRSTRVVVDLLGVAWLMRRPVRYEIVPVAPPTPAPGPVHARPVAVREA